MASVVRDRERRGVSTRASASERHTEAAGRLLLDMGVRSAAVGCAGDVSTELRDELAGALASGLGAGLRPVVDELRRASDLDEMRARLHAIDAELELCAERVERLWVERKAITAEVARFTRGGAA